MPKELFNQATSFQGIRFTAESKLNKENIKIDEEVVYNKDDTFFYKNPNYDINPIGYIPSIIGVKLGELYKQNPIVVHWWARAFGLFAYLLIVFFAIRIMPVHKNVMMLVALAPMSLYQASSVTYDTLCNASTFLMIACILKWLWQKEEVTIRELGLFFLALVLQVFSKAGYYFIPFLLLAVPSKKFSFSYAKIILVVLILAIIKLPSITWSTYLHSSHYPAGESFQRDFSFGFSQNLSFHLHNIPGMIGDLLNNIAGKGKDWIIGAIGKFGYSYTPLPQFWVFMYVLVLLVMATIDNDPLYKLSRMQRLISALVLLVSLGALIAGLYLNFSPIGNSMMFGVQGRYFIPILPLLLFQLYGTLPNNLKRYLPLCTILISIVFLYMTLDYIEKTFYY